MVAAKPMLMIAALNRKDWGIREGMSGLRIIVGGGVEPFGVGVEVVGDMSGGVLDMMVVLD